jgi:hypothetical protein
MNLSTFGQAIECRGFDSLRKLQLSPSGQNCANDTSPVPSSAKHCKTCRLPDARLGQLLLKKNQEFSGEVEQLRAVLHERDERRRELEALDAKTRNAHCKIVESYRLLQDETLAQHDRILQQDDRIAQLERQVQQQLELLRDASRDDDDHEDERRCGGTMNISAGKTASATPSPATRTRSHCRAIPLRPPRPPRRPWWKKAGPVVPRRHRLSWW